MSLPLVAIVGRPNVGKSTLVNRIAESNDAIVHEMRGVTRDRSYHEADWNGLDFMLIDTGGIEMASDDDFQGSIRNQALAAADQADLIVFVVDGKTGLTSEDLDVAKILKKSNADVILAVNKMDNPGAEDGLWEFFELGLGESWPISAAHGHGTGDLLDEVVSKLKEKMESSENDAIDELEKEAIDIAIIGRPNAGKSSLVNKLSNSERSIVSDVAGTTRDAVDTFVEHDGTLYRIIDTAGLRRKSNIDDDVEYYGYVRAMRAIDRAELTILVIDGEIGPTTEDQKVASYSKERGCAMVIALNKWDVVVGPERKADVREKLADDMQFVKYAPVVAISALSGKNLGRLWDAVEAAYASYCSTISTSALNRFLADIKESGYTVTKGKTILRIKYVTQTGTKPPRFTFFCNRPDVVTDNYKRFLENRLRDAFNLTGTPILLSFKKKD